MVAGDGFEPPTFGLWAQRATGLLYPASWLEYKDSNLGMAGPKPAALPLGDTPK